MDKILTDVLKHPHLLGHQLGRTKLTELHSKWIRDVWGAVTKTMAFQAHRGSYKSSSIVELGIPLYLMFHPNKRIALVKETFTEAVNQVDSIRKLMKAAPMQLLFKKIYNKHIYEVQAKKDKVSWEFRQNWTKEGNLDAYGITQLPTGTHYDIAICDDIVTIKSRLSKAARDAVNLFCHEIIHNILDPKGRFILVGTPWHEQDAFNLASADGEPVFHNIQKYNIHDTNILSPEEMAEAQKLPASLFSINYLLEHLGDEGYLFRDPKYHQYPQMTSIGHLDLSYGGEDFTAATCVARNLDRIHVTGSIWQCHFDKVCGQIAKLFKQHQVKICYLEINADKGLSVPMLRKYMPDIGFKLYHENHNKQIKIQSVIRDNWDRIYFDPNCQLDYLQQIMDYTEQAPHDDAPDSLSSLLQQMNMGANALYQY